MSAAHHLGAGEGLLALGSLPQSHEGRHLWRGQKQTSKPIRLVWLETYGHTCVCVDICVCVCLAGVLQPRLSRQTLLGYLDLSASEVGLLDVFDAEVAVALGVLLLFVPRRRLIVGAVRVRRRWKNKKLIN